MSTETILDDDFNAVADSNGNISFSDETLEAPEKYMVAVANVRGNLSWSSASTLGEWVDPDEPDNPDGDDDPIIVETPAVLNFSACMVSPMTVRLEWDKPVFNGTEEEIEFAKKYNLKSVDISSNNGSNWTTIDRELYKDISPSSFINVDGTTRLFVDVECDDISPNTDYLARISTNGNTSFSNTDSLWWIETYKWLSRRWHEANIERLESPLFLALIWRYRTESELKKLIRLRTEDFLSKEQQKILVKALENFEYKTDDYDAIISSYFANIAINSYKLSDGTETNNAAIAILDVMPMTSMFVYPKPGADIASVTWSVETAKGGFNAKPTAISGFSNKPIQPNRCLLEYPFFDKYCDISESLGYNFKMEPVRQTVGGNTVHPFENTGEYIFKVKITPNDGNQIILTFNVTVSE